MMDKHQEFSAGTEGTKQAHHVIFAYKQANDETTL